MPSKVRASHAEPAQPGPRADAKPDCLARNKYNEAKCQDAVRALYDCCRAFYERCGDDATSPSCPKPSLLRLKLKQQGEAASTGRAEIDGPSDGSRRASAGAEAD